LIIYIYNLSLLIKKKKHLSPNYKKYEKYLIEILRQLPYSCHSPAEEGEPHHNGKVLPSDLITSQVQFLKTKQPLS